MAAQFYGHFFGEMVSDDTAEKELWQLTRPLVYKSELLAKTIAVPEGFITDFASIPRLPVIYLLQGGKGKRPAVVHDMLYTSRMYSREVADKVLREAMLAVGYSAETAWLFYQAVRLGGQSHWDKEDIPQPPDVVKLLGMPNQ